MKKPFLFFIILVCALASCKKDETSVPKLEDYRYKPLFGSWFLKAKISTGTTSGTVIATGFTTNDYYKFNENSTYDFSSSSPVAKSSGYYSYMSDGIEAITIGDSRPAGTAYTITRLTTDSLTFFNNVVTATDTIKVTYKFAHI